MIVLGLLFGTVGQDLFSGTPRYTFGIRELYSGITVSVAVGMFGVAEILRNLEDERGRTVLVDKVKGSSRPARTSAVPLGQFFGERPSDPPSGFSGSRPRARLVRLLQHREADLPDAEGVRAGAIEGVAGPESANNAAAQTSFIPLLTLGLPAHPVMALMLGAFIIQDLSRAERDQRGARAVLGPHRLDVGRERAAPAPQPAAHRAVGPPPPRPLPRPVPGDRGVRLHRHVLDQRQRLRRLRDPVLRAAGLWAREAGLRAGALLLGFVLGPLLENHMRRADHRPRRRHDVRHAPDLADAAHRGACGPHPGRPAFDPPEA